MLASSEANSPWLESGIVPCYDSGSTTQRLVASFPKENIMETIALRNVKPGDYVKRKADSKAVYIKRHYDKMTKSFCLVDVEDISRCIFVKANKPVVVGFTY